MLEFSRGRDQRATWCFPKHCWSPNRIRITDWAREAKVFLNCSFVESQYMCAFFPEFSESVINQEIILATIGWKVRHCTKLSHLQGDGTALFSQIRKLRLRIFNHQLKVFQWVSDKSRIQTLVFLSLYSKEKFYMLRSSLHWYWHVFVNIES